MIDWIRRMMRGSSDTFDSTADMLNALSGGGKPITVRQQLGSLAIHSGALSLGDPQNPVEVQVSGIVASKVAISAVLKKYPKGQVKIAELSLRFGESPKNGSLRKVGTIAIDSARVVVADATDLKNHWTDVGKDRIGLISTLKDNMRSELTKRFKLKTKAFDPFHVAIVGPVSKQLEQDIFSYLSMIPKCKAFPFLYFSVRTNNSFERVIFEKEVWRFMPIGNEPTPLLFACNTGHGDGKYVVNGIFAGEEPRALKIVFIVD